MRIIKKFLFLQLIKLFVKFLENKTGNDAIKSF